MPSFLGGRGLKRTHDQSALSAFSEHQGKACSQALKQHDRKQKFKENQPLKTHNLLNLARRGNWQALAKFSAFYANELLEKDANGLVPLHFCCRCPSICTYVFRALVTAKPYSARIVDNEGSTPLHYLLHYTSPNDEVLRLLIDAYPEALAVRDIYGRTPLYHAMEKNLSMNRVKVILQYKEAFESILLCCGPDLQGKYQDPRYSRGSVVHQSVYSSSEIDTERTPLFIAWRNTLTPLDGSDFKAKGKRWEKAMLLLKTVYSHRHPKGKFRVLHAMLEFLPYLPLEIHDFLFTISPRDIREPEETSGRLPIHIVASLDMNDDEIIYLVETLLDLYPESIRHKASNGRLPLHEGIEAGSSWKVFKRLFDEYPGAMLAVDEVTGLYPFMLAARSSSKRKHNSEVVKTGQINRETVNNVQDSAPMKGDEGKMETVPRNIVVPVEQSHPESNLELTTLYEIVQLNSGFFGSHW